MKRPHWLPRLRRPREECPECGAADQQKYCEVCGYDLVTKTRSEVFLPKPPV